MKLQVAIDRVTLAKAKEFACLFNGKVDLLEIGTSLVKDYGNQAIAEIRQQLPDSDLLVDLKTMDEGAYEFKQGFKYGGDILTVMGAASVATIRACYEVTKAHKKTMMIDLLEVTDEKIEQLVEFEEAVFAIHHSVDREDKLKATTSVAEFKQKFPSLKRLAIAGGIDLEQARQLTDQGVIEIIIVGSSITKTISPLETVHQFMEVIKK